MIFSRNVKGLTETLKKSSIAIAGCGGLGSNVAVSLTRAGIGKLITADFDKVELSNLNRQHFFQQDVGQPKAEALTRHLKSINPEIEIESHNIKLTPSHISELFGSANLLIEAFDNAEAKAWLIETWCTFFPSKPIICGSGLSGLGDTESLKVRKVGQIYICGDEKTDMSMGLCAPRVNIVANMQANIAIELLMQSNKNSQ